MKHTDLRWSGLRESIRKARCPPVPCPLSSLRKGLDRFGTARRGSIAECIASVSSGGWGAVAGRGARGDLVSRCASRGLDAGSIEHPRTGGVASVGPREQRALARGDGSRWRHQGIRVRGKWTLWCTGSFGNELPSLSSAQRSFPSGTASITHVADDVTSSQTSGHLAQSRAISRYGYRTHVSS